jgi:hypothetical protein
MIPQFPTYPIQELYLFPYYRTREEYKRATGKEAPPYKPYKPRKHWFDPAAANSANRYITYPHAIVTKADGVTPAIGPDRKPVIDQLILLKEDAAELNIPPTEPVAADEIPVILPEIQVPLRPLDPREELDFAFGGAVIVKNLDLYEEIAEGGFGSQDRKLLKAIAEKLGVSY